MSETWDLLQYQAYAQPVPLDPAEQVNPVWFPQWTQPIDQPVLPVEYRHTLPSFFFVGEPSDFVVVTVPDYGWWRQTEEPVFTAEYRHLLPSVFFTGEPDDFPAPAALSDFAWFRQPDEPVLPVEFRHLIPSVFIPPFEEIISTDSGVFFEAWTQPIQQPVLPVEYRHLLPGVFGQIEPSDFSTGAAPPTAFPLNLILTEANRFNQAVSRKSANDPAESVSKNDIEL